MADNINNLLLEHMKRIQAEMSGLRESNRDIISRLGHIEMVLADHTVALAEHTVRWAEQSVRLDRVVERLDRIERRLELTV